MEAAVYDRLGPALIDIHLRGGTGFDVLKGLDDLSSYRDVPKIVLTNHGGDDYRTRSLDLGAAWFYDKMEVSLALDLIAQLATAGERLVPVIDNEASTASQHMFRQPTVAPQLSKRRLHG